MERSDAALVREIREFSRFYTNLLGLLDQGILDSPYSLTEARILLEIGVTADCAANDLAAKLKVDRGYMSRIISRFEADGLVSRSVAPADKRRRLLSLTEQGKQVLAALEAKSESQIRIMIEPLTGVQKQKLAEAVRYIKRCLAPDPVTIRTFRPEDIEWVIRRHRELYAEEYGFTAVFGDYVDICVKKFAAHHDPEKENIWIAELAGKPVGVIAIVRVDDATAQLRWFLMEPSQRGKGLGHRMMQTVLDFCREKHYRQILLWTVNVLGAARHLYAVYGFKMTESHPNDEWSREPIAEERWDLFLPEDSGQESPGNG